MRGALNAVALAVVLLASHAHADARSDARAEYERGKRAHAQRDYAEAARAFARADEIVPSPVSLQAALEEAVRAEDAELSRALCDRAEQRSETTPALSRAVAEARARFPAPPPPAPAAPEPPAPEPSTAPPAAEPSPASTAPPAAAPTPPPSARSHGLSPGLFWAGVGVTGALGAAAIATSALTASTHGSFEDDGCAARNVGRCADLAARGQTLQSVSLGLLAGTAVVGVSTILVGVFATNWKGKASVALAPTPRGGFVSATIAF